MTKEEAKKWLSNQVNDIFMDLLYYNRKEDEDLNVDQLRELMDNGTISKKVMIEVFLAQIEKEYKP